MIEYNIKLFIIIIIITVASSDAVMVVVVVVDVFVVAFSHKLKSATDQKFKTFMAIMSLEDTSQRHGPQIEIHERLNPNIISKMEQKHRGLFHRC